MLPGSSKSRYLEAISVVRMRPLGGQPGPTLWNRGAQERMQPGRITGGQARPHPAKP